MLKKRVVDFERCNWLETITFISDFRNSLLVKLSFLPCSDGRWIKFFSVWFCVQSPFKKTVGDTLLHICPLFTTWPQMWTFWVCVQDPWSVERKIIRGLGAKLCARASASIERNSQYAQLTQCGTIENWVSVLRRHAHFNILFDLYFNIHIYIAIYI